MKDPRDRSRIAGDTFIHQPDNKGQRVDQVWCFISSDATGEGICAFTMPNGLTMPLIACDMARLNSIRPLAKELARRGGVKIKLIKLSVRDDIEDILP